MQLFQKNEIKKIVTSLQEGNVLVFPTETSYGLGGDATNKQVVEKIFKIKNRSNDKPLLILLPNVKAVKKYLIFNQLTDAISKRYWPGPLTIVGMCQTNEEKNILPLGVVSNDGTIAVRVPKDRWLNKILKKFGRPLIATSANISSEASIYDYHEILNTFNQKEYQPDTVVIGGKLKPNLATTLVNVTGEKPIVLRQGELKLDNNLLQNKISRGWWRQSLSLWWLVGILTVFFISAITIVYVWQMTMMDFENIGDHQWLVKEVSIQGGRKNKSTLTNVKGLYLTAYSAGSQKKMDEIIDLIKRTELNAVVIDIKDYSGLILYDSHIPQVNEFRTKDNRLGDASALIEKLHQENIYVIARQTVFQDPILAERNPDWAIKNKTGGIWRDYKGLAWVDPTLKEVWQYNLAIAKEAIRLGFDEINFDYVRFPSDGKMSEVVYMVGDKKKYEIMREFFIYLDNGFKNEPAWLSLDMFGFVMEKTGEDDMNIGQRLVDAVDYADYICPMMYPSHYPAGHLGLSNPADFPGKVFDNGMRLGMPWTEGKRAKIRPWLQAFNIGAVYDATKIRAQIEVVEKYSDAGWLLWNAANRYTDAGLKKIYD